MGCLALPSRRAAAAIRSGSACTGSRAGDGGSSSTSSCRPMMSGDISRATGRRAPGIHFPESLVDHTWGLRGRFDTFCPFCQALQDTKLIRNFMQETDTFPYPFRWDLSGQTQHPFVTLHKRYTGLTWYSVSPVRGLRCKRPVLPVERA